mmetsp:Transcript_123152/g.307520  ORF Transcript_123152/g.307520 Transcript_123152/m.307520 type:complete len:231 (-) Transcript_123152:1386-2078(-)
MLVDQGLGRFGLKAPHRQHDLPFGQPTCLGIDMLVEECRYLTELLLAEEPHETQVLTEVELATVVLVDLGDVDVNLVHRLPISQLPKQISKLQSTDFTSFVNVMSVEDFAHLLHVGFRKALTLLERQHEVEKLVEIQLSIVVFVNFHIDLIQILLKRRISLLTQHASELFFANHSIPIRICIRKIGIAAGQFRMIALQTRQRLLSSLPGENQKLREAQTFRFRASSYCIG